MEQTETQQNNLQELVVYHLVDMHFVWGNTYALDGVRPNAQQIASWYGCQLEFRESQFKKTGVDNSASAYLELEGISLYGSFSSAILKGTDRKQLEKARYDIHRAFGVRRYGDKALDVRY